MPLMHNHYMLTDISNFTLKFTLCQCKKKTIAKVICIKTSLVTCITLEHFFICTNCIVNIQVLFKFLALTVQTTRYFCFLGNQQNYFLIERK